KDGRIIVAAAQPVEPGDEGSNRSRQHFILRPFREVGMHDTRRTRLAVYGLAVLATGISLLLRWPLRPVLGDAVPHMTFFPAVMIAAYFGGFWPGLLATILSAVAANYFLTKQLASWHVTSVNDVAALILFVLVGAIISGLCESLHRAR